MERTIEQLHEWVDQNEERIRIVVAALDMVGEHGKVEFFVRDGELQDPRIQPQLRLQPRVLDT
jgi:hypothetical protein